MGKKDKKKAEKEAPTVVLQEELSGTLDKFCGNGFKPRFFRLTHGLLRYYREEPRADNPNQDCLYIGYLVDLLKGFDHMGLMEGKCTCHKPCNRLGTLRCRHSDFRKALA